MKILILTSLLYVQYIQAAFYPMDFSSGEFNETSGSFEDDFSTSSNFRKATMFFGELDGGSKSILIPKSLVQKGSHSVNLAQSSSAPWGYYFYPYNQAQFSNRQQDYFWKDVSLSRVHYYYRDRANPNKSEYVPGARISDFWDVFYPEFKNYIEHKTQLSFSTYQKDYYQAEQQGLNQAFSFTKNDIETFVKKGALVKAARVKCSMNPDRSDCGLSLGDKLDLYAAFREKRSVQSLSKTDGIYHYPGAYFSEFGQRVSAQFMAMDEENGNLDDEGWTGLCDEGGIASVSGPEPKARVEFKDPRVGKNGYVTFSVRDIKLLNLKTSEYTGRHLFGANDDVRGISPGQFHLILWEMFEKQHKPILIDYEKGREVWTAPIYSVNFKVRQRPGNASKLDFITAVTLFDSKKVSPFDTDTYQTAGLLSEIQSTKVYKYSLTVKPASKSGYFKVVSGQWTSEDYPDYVLMPQTQINQLESSGAAYDYEALFERNKIEVFETDNDGFSIPVVKDESYEDWQNRVKSLKKLKGSTLPGIHLDYVGEIIRASQKANANEIVEVHL